MTTPVLNPQSLLQSVGERWLLRHLRGRIPAANGVIVGIGDDAAAVEIGPLALVTTDSMVENVHFQRDAAPPCLLGRKALSVNLSDIASMGGVSRYATVSLCLPAELELGWVDELYDGLLARAAEVEVAIVGGNVTRTGDAVVIDVTLLGSVSRPLLRSGARPGDKIVVTGTLGAAAEGVRLLKQGARLLADGTLARTGIWTESSAEEVTACLRAQLDPRPQLSIARELSERSLATACMDLSDGLSSDLAAMCTESGVRAVVESGAVPVDPRVTLIERARGGDALSLALHGGEDYELLLAVDPMLVPELTDVAGVWNVPVTVIGEFLQGEPGVLLRDASGEHPLEARGHDHFGSARAGSR